MVGLFGLSLIAVASATPLFTPPADPTLSNRLALGKAPIVASVHPHGTIDDSFIVMLKPNTDPSVMDNHLSFLADAHAADPLSFHTGEEGGVTHIYNSHIKGYAGKFTSGVIDRIRDLPEVAYVEKDQVVKATELDTEISAPWGLARISHRPKLTLRTFQKYEYDNDGGEGVDVYVIDTGINIEHAEFEGRAIWGKTIPKNDADIDGNGHGTHCAGTIASAKYGVAKKANVIAVKVLGTNGSGSMSDVVSGVVWAYETAQAKAAAAEEEFKATGNTTHKGSVANMSLGGGKSQALDDAVDKAAEEGLHFAVAAGNDNKDACDFSPAASKNAVTVGASTRSDDRAYFSNYGKCVDVFAPGLAILSTWKGGKHAINTISGTSMASPHVAGLLAYYLSLYGTDTFNPSIDSEAFEYVEAAQQTLSTSTAGVYGIIVNTLPHWLVGYLPSPRLVSSVLAPTPSKPKKLTTKQLKTALLNLATKDILKDVGAGSPNLLIFNNATSS